MLLMLDVLLMMFGAPENMFWLVVSTMPAIIEAVGSVVLFAAVLCWRCGWGRDAIDDCFAAGGKLGLGRWCSSSLPSNAALLSEADFPSIQSTRPGTSKSPLTVAASVSPVCGLGVTPPTPSPPAFQSSYVAAQFCFELPDSFNDGGGSPSRLGSPPRLPEKAVCVDCAPGPPSPDPPLDESFHGVPGSPSNAMLWKELCLCLGLSPLARPSCFLLIVGRECILSQLFSLLPRQESWDNALPPHGDVLDRPCSLAGAPVTSSGSNASANPMGAVDRPLGMLSSSVVKQNSPGGTLSTLSLNGHGEHRGRVEYHLVSDDQLPCIGNESSLSDEKDRAPAVSGPHEAPRRLDNDLQSSSTSGEVNLTSLNTHERSDPVSDVSDSSSSDQKSNGRGQNSGPMDSDALHLSIPSPKMSLECMDPNVSAHFFAVEVWVYSDPLQSGLWSCIAVFAGLESEVAQGCVSWS
ncbi:hypothetical protein Nepgr_002676 [Nepenthes gracilis]|uniref:Uncharacterized protein n=1 Tax=Nepenthes gracilis TaxID=150966 RepID=A0AAD3P7H7_NEPGR|nr:hypothetical protein Nepgr_002676 [Nepenthes gracilis]